MFEYHELTKHGHQITDRRQLVDFEPLDPANMPRPFKHYPGRPSEPLPPDLQPGSLSHLLFYAAGVTRHAGGRYFRTFMSAGNLQPIELYVLDDNGVRHFAPDAFGLTALRDGSYPPSIIVTGIPWRTAWKYGERGLRHLYWDAGTMLANLLAITDGAHVRLDFDDAAVARLIGVDGVSEFPLAVVTLGDHDPPGADVDPALPLIAAERVSPRPIEFPLITAMQHAGNAPVTSGVTIASRRVAGIEPTILQRGSTRLFTRDPLPLAVLDDGLTWAGGDLVEHFIAVHAVDGLDPGTYRWAGDHAELLRAGDTREVTQALCLHQPLGGDAAFTVFHCADLSRLNERGYRAAQLESGIASGRVALTAFRRGAGATGLTFYDDQVSAFFRTDASCMLVTAVGAPAYRNKAGGRPGQLAELSGFERVMVRLSQRLDEAR